MTVTQRSPRREGTRLLAVGVAAAAVAACGLRPLTRRWPAAVVVSVPALLATELPLESAALALAAAVAAGRRGHHRGVPGRVGTALVATSTAVFAVLAWRTRSVDTVLAAALRHGLPATGPLPRGRPGWPGWCAVRRYRTAALRGVAYGADPAQTLDVWRRPDLAPDARAPVFVQVHGGAWSSGRKEDEAVPLMTRLTRAGWVCVAVDYRLGPTSRWPTMIDDVRAALGWVRGHVAALGGDPDRIAVGGGSAGAHLAALAALTDEAPPGRAAVAAAVTSYGIYDLTSDDGSGTLGELLEATMMPSRDDEPGAWAEGSPTLRVHPGAPSFLVVHGTGDAVVAPGQSRAFVRALRAVGRAPVVYAELPHAQHAFDALPTARTRRVVRAVEVFLTAVVGPGAVGPPR